MKMFESELFIKIRAYFILGVILLIFPGLLTLTFIAHTIEFFYRKGRPKSIAGDTAVVTGSGHGLGRCIALELAKKGANIAVVDINLEGAEETKALINAQCDVKCKAYKVDVTDFSQIENLNNSIKKEMGAAATILVNNAGILTLSSFPNPRYDEIGQMIDVNLKAQILTNKVFLENMKECGKGHIVAISSIAGMFPLIFNSVYCATKYAVRGMMKSIRIDLKALKYDNIKTTTVYPSFLSTNDRVVEVSHEVQLHNVYPLIRGEAAARTIVEAMLRNEEEVAIPKAFTLLYHVFDIFPASYQDILYIFTNHFYVKRFEKIYKDEEKLLLETK